MKDIPAGAWRPAPAPAIGDPFKDQSWHGAHGAAFLNREQGTLRYRPDLDDGYGTAWDSALQEALSHGLTLMTDDPIEGVDDEGHPVSLFLFRIVNKQGPSSPSW